jgi:hypothetical protein
VVDASLDAVVTVLRLSRYIFEEPAALLVAGPDLFVANLAGSVTELNASNGSLVRVLGSDLDQPAAIVATGPDLFAANSEGAVTEVSISTGAMVRWRSGSDGDVNTPAAMAAAGPDLFVANGTGVLELNALTGAAVRKLSASGSGSPGAMVVAGPDLFVANVARPVGEPPQGTTGGNSVSEVNISTGALVRALSGSRYRFNDPVALTRAGPDVFVANSIGNSLTEVDASTGALVRVLSSSEYRFDRPDAMAVAGTELFVANSGGNSVTELPA